MEPSVIYQEISDVFHDINEYRQWEGQTLHTSQAPMESDNSDNQERGVHETKQTSKNHKHPGNQSCWMMLQFLF